MSEQVSASLIKETQDALSKYVKKPPLTEKLLKKPPFRYLHDIVTALIKETSFLDGLFTAEELDSSNIKDKESKIAFLNKLISAVKKATGKNITVRAAKIVAGLEVHKTLELLQLIGKAIHEKLDANNSTQSSELKNVELPNTKNDEEKEKKVGEKISEGESKESKKLAEEVNATQQGNYKKQAKKEDNNKRKNSIEKSDHKSKMEATGKNVTEPPAKGLKIASSSEPKKIVPTKSIVKRNSISSKSTPIRRPSLKDNKQNFIHSSKPLQSVIKEEKEESKEAAESKHNKEKEAPEKNKIEKKNMQQIAENKSKNETGNAVINKNQNVEMTVKNEDTKHGQVLLKDDEKQENYSIKRRESAAVPRPGSARPGSRKLIHNDENKTFKESSELNENELKENELKNRIPSSIRPRTASRPASARPGAPRIRDRGEVAAVEEQNPAIAPVNVIEEGKTDQIADDKDNFIIIEPEKGPLQMNDMTVVNESEQGQLVHQILKTQKELNESIVTDNKGRNKQLRIEWEAGKEAEKNVISEEIEKIRKSIQLLTSAANPLGKLFDFLQEDVDEMQRELQHWKNMNEKFHKQQTSELELGKTLLQPLQKQLSDVENNIEEEYLQIASIKMSILNNDEKIMKLVTHSNPKIRIK